MKMLVLTMAVLAAVAVGAQAASVVLSDSQLGNFVDSGWYAGSSHAPSDIAGDPGTQWDITFQQYVGGYADYDVHNYTDVSFNVGDTWDITLVNTSGYYVYVDLYINDSSWVWMGGPADYLDPFETQSFSMPMPTASIGRLGIGFNVPDWSGSNMPSGDTIGIQIVPEPATLALIALGVLGLRKRKA